MHLVLFYFFWGRRKDKKLTQIYGATDVLKQSGQLGSFKVGESCLVLGNPLVKVTEFALNCLLHRSLL